MTTFKSFVLAGLAVLSLGAVAETDSNDLDPRNIPVVCSLGDPDSRGVCSETNELRTRYRVQILRADPKLNRVAAEYARVLYNWNGGRGSKLSHNIPGHEFSRRMRENGITTACGENIAVGYRDPASVVRGWEHSPGHFRNLVNRGYTKIGAAEYNGFWVQVFSR